MDISRAEFEKLIDHVQEQIRIMVAVSPDRVMRGLREKFGDAMTPAQWQAVEEKLRQRFGEVLTTSEENYQRIHRKYT